MNIHQRTAGWWLVVVACAVLAAAALPAVASAGGRQTGGAAPAAPPDEAELEVRLLSSRYAFERDGRRTVETTADLLVRTPSGVQAVGTVTIPFRQGASTPEVKYVRVRKPDGAVVETPVTEFFDLPAPPTQLSAEYSDLYLRHIEVRGLQPGDTLEYAWQLTEPSLVPGHFWLVETLDLGPLAGRHVVEASWPADVQATVANGRHVPEIATVDDRIVYRWDSARAEGNEPDEAQADTIRVSSFRDWAEVGAVVGELWRGRAAATPEIRAKAAELTAGLTTNDAKARAIYRYVATNVRYVGVAIGVGRIQPNPAATVLARGFGDCKDKHVLLEALLGAVGIEATPVLIGPGAVVDRDVPSLDQFTHVITLIPRGLAEPVWLDSTTEVAPFGFLLASERDATVLALPADAEPALMTTPARASVEALWRTELTGRLTSDGQLEAAVREELAGDIEVVLRAAFSSVGRAQWIKLVEVFPLARQYGGTVTDIVATPPEDIDSPFRVEYRFTADGAVDFSRGTLRLPLVFDIPTAPASADSGPTDLVPGTLVAVSKLELPEGIEVTAGQNEPIELTSEFGRYRFRWSADGKVIDAERVFSLTAGELAEGQVGTYGEFLEEARASSYTIRVARFTPWAWDDSLTIDWYENASPEASAALKRAADTAHAGNHQRAMGEVRKVLEAEPESDAAWQMLAWMQLSSGGSAARGIDTLKRRLPLAAGPSLLKYYASHLLTGRQRAEAAEVLRTALERFPDDEELPLYLAETLVAIDRGAEAVPLLMTAADRQRDSARFQLVLARAQFAARNVDAALAGFLRSAELDERPEHLDRVARELNVRRMAADSARRLAERAVRETSARIAALQLDMVTASDMRVMASLPDMWRTLGEVLLAEGDNAAAMRYLDAAWQVSQDPAVAFTLGPALGMSGNTAAAEQYVLYGEARGQETSIRLASDPGLASRAADVARAREELNRALTIQLPGDLDVQAPLDVLLAVDRAGRPTSVRRLGGALPEPVEAALRSVDVSWSPPDQDITQMLRRGTVSCARGGCALLLRNTGDAARGVPE